MHPPERVQTAQVRPQQIALLHTSFIRGCLFRLIKCALLLCHDSDFFQHLSPDFMPTTSLLRTLTLVPHALTLIRSFIEPEEVYEQVSHLKIMDVIQITRIGYAYQAKYVGECVCAVERRGLFGRLATPGASFASPVDV